MASESKSVQDEETTVNEDEVVDLALKQKADVLRENGIDVFQVSNFRRPPTIFFVGDGKEGPRAFDIAIEQGWDVSCISLSWDNYHGKLDSPTWSLVFEAARKSPHCNI